jgi:hypothetical protein
MNRPGLAPVKFIAFVKPHNSYLKAHGCRVVTSRDSNLKNYWRLLQLPDHIQDYRQGRSAVGGWAQQADQMLIAHPSFHHGREICQRKVKPSRLPLLIVLALIVVEIELLVERGIELESRSKDSKSGQVNTFRQSGRESRAAS